MARTKAMLASDWEESKVRFPCIVQPKIDGVRGIHLDPGVGLTGRSGKAHANQYTSAIFSNSIYLGFDGELIAGAKTDPDLCRLTTSACNTIGGRPSVTWIVFDYITPETIDLPYAQRLGRAHHRVGYLNESAKLHGYQSPCLELIQSLVCANLEQLLELDAQFLDQGYEGTIIRDMDGKYKQGRSTVREMGLLRIKRFSDAEAIVVSIEEGQRNDNEATRDVHGYTERSTHQENMVPNGMVGALICKNLNDGETIKVSAGCMSHEERVSYFLNPEKLIGKVVKYKHFAHGQKDKPRFPTFQCLRAESDL